MHPFLKIPLPRIPVSTRAPPPGITGAPSFIGKRAGSRERRRGAPGSPSSRECPSPRRRDRRPGQGKGTGAGSRRRGERQGEPRRTRTRRPEPHVRNRPCACPSTRVRFPVPTGGTAAEQDLNSLTGGVGFHVFPAGGCVNSRSGRRWYPTPNPRRSSSHFREPVPELLQPVAGPAQLLLGEQRGELGPQHQRLDGQVQAAPLP